MLLMNKAPKPDVIIIGAGLSGLSAANKLKKAGISFTILESSGRAGGRAWTAHLFSPRFYEEQGASYICSEHSRMQDLAAEFKVPLLSLTSQKIQNLHAFVWDNKIFTPRELFDLFEPTLRNISRDKALAKNSNELCSLNISAYLKKLKAPLLLEKWVNIATLNEFGSSPPNMSACQLFDLTWVDFERREFSFLAGAGDEKFIVKDGISKLVEAVADTVRGHIKFNHQVVEIVEDKRVITVKVNTPEGAKSIKASQVIVSVPLAVLKNHIALDIGTHANHKLNDYLAAQQEGYNQKVFYYFSKPMWSAKLAGASTFAIDGQLFIDNTFLQNIDGIFCLMNFRGGQNDEIIDAALAEDTLRSLFRLMPELRAHYLGFRIGMNWGSYPHALMSYTGAAKPTNYQSDLLLVEKISKKVLLTGEFWSEDYQGFMEGAVETGQRAAELIIQG